MGGGGGVAEEMPLMVEEMPLMGVEETLLMGAGVTSSLLLHQPVLSLEISIFLVCLGNDGGGDGGGGGVLLPPSSPSDLLSPDGFSQQHRRWRGSTTISLQAGTFLISFHLRDFGSIRRILSFFFPPLFQ